MSHSKLPSIRALTRPVGGLPQAINRRWSAAD